MEIIKLIITALFVTILSENVIFSKSFGADTIVRISENKKNIFGFGVAVTYMCTVANVIVWLLNHYLSGDESYHIYEPVLYACTLCLLYFVTIMIAWKFTGEKAKKVRNYLHFAVFNSAVLGTMVISSESLTGIVSYVVYGFGMGIGYSLALFITSLVYERLDSDYVPKAFRGYPSVLIFLGIIGMALHGLS